MLASMLHNLTGSTAYLRWENHYTLNCHDFIQVRKVLFASQFNLKSAHAAIRSWGGGEKIGKYIVVAMHDMTQGHLCTNVLNTRGTTLSVFARVNSSKGIRNSCDRGNVKSVWQF
jgi:hypothetical protein